MGRAAPPLHFYFMFYGATFLCMLDTATIFIYHQAPWMRNASWFWIDLPSHHRPPSLGDPACGGPGFESCSGHLFVYWYMFLFLYIYIYRRLESVLVTYELTMELGRFM